MICKYCNIEFETHKTNRVYCTDKCAYEKSKALQRTYANCKIEHKCEKCNAIFTKSRNSKKKVLCSDCSKQISYRTRHLCFDCRHAYVNVCEKIKTLGKVVYEGTVYNKKHSKLLIHECPNFIEDIRKHAKDKQSIIMKTNITIEVN